MTLGFEWREERADNTPFGPLAPEPFDHRCSVYNPNTPDL
jgi:hypothetical protein